MFGNDKQRVEIYIPGVSEAQDIAKTTGVALMLFWFVVAGLCAMPIMAVVYGIGRATNYINPTYVHIKNVEISRIAYHKAYLELKKHPAFKDFIYSIEKEDGHWENTNTHKVSKERSHDIQKFRFTGRVRLHNIPGDPDAFRLCTYNILLVFPHPFANDEPKRIAWMNDKSEVEKYTRDAKNWAVGPSETGKPPFSVDDISNKVYNQKPVPWNYK